MKKINAPVSILSKLNKQSIYAHQCSSVLARPLSMVVVDHPRERVASQVVVVRKFRYRLKILSGLFGIIPSHKFIIDRELILCWFPPFPEVCSWSTIVCRRDSIMGNRWSLQIPVAIKFRNTNDKKHGGYINTLSPLPVDIIDYNIVLTRSIDRPGRCSFDDRNNWVSN